MVLLLWCNPRLNLGHIRCPISRHWDLSFWDHQIFYPVFLSTQIQHQMQLQTQPPIRQARLVVLFRYIVENHLEVAFTDAFAPFFVSLRADKRGTMSCEYCECPMMGVIVKYKDDNKEKKTGIKEGKYHPLYLLYKFDPDDRICWDTIGVNLWPTSIVCTASIVGFALGWLCFRK